MTTEMENRSPGPVLILPALHLLLCLFVEFAISDESFKWFFVAIIDLPFYAVTRMIPGFADDFLTYGVFGTLCWYCVSWGFRFLFRAWMGYADRKR
jgi:ABC-type sulfate transport system permease subunit